MQIRIRTKENDPTVGETPLVDITGLTFDQYNTIQKALYYGANKCATHEQVSSFTESQEWKRLKTDMRALNAKFVDTPKSHT